MGEWGQETGQPRSSTAGRQGTWAELQLRWCQGNLLKSFPVAGVQAQLNWPILDLGLSWLSFPGSSSPHEPVNANPCHVMGHNRSVTLVCIRWLGLSNTDQVSYQLSCESDLDYNIDINILITCMLLRILMTNVLCLCLLRIRNWTLVHSWSECGIRAAAATAVNMALLLPPACPWTLTLLAPSTSLERGLCSQLLCSCVWGSTGSYEKGERRCFCILCSLRQCENLPNPCVTIIFDSQVL